MSKFLTSNEFIVIGGLGLILYFWLQNIELEQKSKMEGFKYANSGLF